MTIHVWLRYSVTLGVALMLSSSVLAQRPAAHEVDKHFESAILSAASARKLALDPQLSRDMIEDISRFTGNFCVGMLEACDRILGNMDNLQQILQQYLADAEMAPGELETLASRMALAAGSDITKAGWPRMQPNTLGIVEVSPQNGDVVFYLRTGNGIAPLGGQATKLLMQPGSWTILVESEDGERTQKSVVVQPRKTSLLTGTDGSGAAGRIDVTRKDYCPVTRTDATNEILAPFNLGRAVQPGGEYSHAATVTHQKGIRISIDDQTGLCDDDCLQGISAAFARALAVWRSGCGRCTNNSLAVIVSDRNLWLDRRAAARLRAFSSTDPDIAEVDLEQVDYGLPFPTGAVPSLSVPTKSFVGYDHVSADADLMKKLCSTNSPTGSDWIANAQSFACGRQESTEPALSPRLSLLTGETPCGSAAVACGTPEGEMQITLKDYALTVPSVDGRLQIGSGTSKLDVQAILLHEVGHWFGIPHPESVGLETKDIMSAVLNARHICVSAQSIALLTNATDTRFAQRARGSNGLTVDESSFTTDAE